MSKKDYATVDEFLAAVAEKVAKRVEQIRTGIDLPGTRAPADPKAKRARELMKKAEELGLDEAEANAAIEAAAKKKARANAA